MTVLDRLRRLLGLERPREPGNWTEEVETLDAKGRIAERTFLYPSYERIERRVKRYDPRGRVTEELVHWRDGTRLRTTCAPDGDETGQEWYRADGTLEKRLAIEYAGAEAILTTYDGEGRQLSQERLPRRVVDA